MLYFKSCAEEAKALWWRAAGEERRHGSRRTADGGRRRFKFGGPQMGSRERKKAAASSQNHKSKEFRASTSSSAVLFSSFNYSISNSLSSPNLIFEKSIKSSLILPAPKIGLFKVRDGEASSLQNYPQNFTGIEAENSRGLGSRE